MPKYIISLEKFDEQLDREVGLEELVECKDCKFMEIEQSGKYLVAICPFRKQILNPSGFCDLAERRE